LLQSSRIAPPSALAGRPLLHACHPAETIGEDSAARLVVKATHFVWRSAALLSAALLSAALLSAALLSAALLSASRQP
jgi:hypothetical protein